MGVGHIIFILLNMAVPYWIWTSNSENVQIDWKNFDKNLARIIDAKKGFENCPTPAVVTVIHELCVQSASQLKEHSVAAEKSAQDLKVICEVGENVTIVTFQAFSPQGSDTNGELHMRAPSAEPLSEEKPAEPTDEAGQEPPSVLNSEGGLMCKSRSGIKDSPSFLFNTSGWLTHIDFNTASGRRQRVPVQNCRVKLKRADRIKPAPATREEFLMKLPRLHGDPEDVYGANQACLDYDVAIRWKNWRAKFDL
jgi:hypothetical protein